MAYMKAQSSIEFVIIIGVLLFFFSSFTIFINQSLADKAREQRTNTLNELALNVQEEIALAREASDGYYRVFVLPDNVVNVPYNVTLGDSYVYFYTLDFDLTISIPVSNVTGYLKIGSNTLEKIDGLVYLNR